MKRICCYSLHIPGYGRPDLLQQLLLSVRSLRQHNSKQEVVVFAHERFSGEVGRQLTELQARIWYLPSYQHRLHRLCPEGAPFLTQCPLLHKLMNFSEIGSLAPDQVMLLDCDTIFRRDVAEIFQRYGDHDVVAREEVGSRRNHHGYDRSMVDEDVLAGIGQRVGVEPAAPINLGVMLLDGKVIYQLAGLGPVFVQYAWRFLLWMAQNPPQSSSEYGEGMGVDDLRSSLGSISPAALAMALEFPSKNRWILDEASFWMTLGHLPGLRPKDFDRGDVAQNGEFDDQSQSQDWVLCHYFSQNFQRVASLFASKGAATP